MRRWGSLRALLLAVTACRPAPIGRAPSTFVPAQTLHFQDAAGVEFGTLTVGPDGSLKLSCRAAPRATDLTVTLRRDGQLSAALGVPPVGRPAVSFSVGPELSFGFLDANGRYETVSGRRAPLGADWVTARRMTARLYHLVVPWTPGLTIDQAIPDQDRQFVDRDGRTFAVLGLSSAAEPGVGLSTRTGGCGCR